MSLLSSGYKKKRNGKVKKGVPYYHTVKLKPGEKLWALNLKTEWLEEVEVYQVKQGGKTYVKKEQHIYAVAKTIEQAQRKINRAVKKMAEAYAKTLAKPKMKPVE